MSTFGIILDSEVLTIEAKTLKEAALIFENKFGDKIPTKAVYLVRPLIVTPANQHFANAARIAKEGRESSFPPKVLK